MRESQIPARVENVFDELVDLEPAGVSGRVVAEEISTTRLGRKRVDRSIARAASPEDSGARPPAGARSLLAQGCIVLV